jgi:hypothetical protein
MRGAIPPLPQYVFMAWCLVKHRDNFTFLPFKRDVVNGKFKVAHSEELHDLCGVNGTVTTVKCRRPRQNGYG